MSGPTPTDSNGHSTDRPAELPPSELIGPESPTPEVAGPVEPLAHRPIGGSVFALEGRAAPGLYLVGWIATVLGIAIFTAELTAGPTGPGAVILLLIALVLLTVGLIAAAGAQGIERRARGVAGYFGPSPFLVFVATVPVTLLLTIVVTAPLTAAGLDSRGPAAIAVQESVLLVVNIGLIQLLVVSAGALSWADMGCKFRGLARTLGDLAAGALLALPVWLATIVAVAIAMTFIHHETDNPLPPSVDATSLGINLLTAAVIAPIAEEIFFRGFATTAWVATMGRQQGLVRGAIFFAFVHVFNASGVNFGDALAEAAVGFIARIPVGFALGWIFLQRRSIFASIGLHSSFNAIQVILAYLITTP